MARVLRVSIKGQLPNGEEWSVNPVYSIGGDFGAPVSAAQANTIAQAIAAAPVPSNLQPMWSSSTSMTAYRVEARNLDGTLESLAESVRAAPIGGTGTAPHPFQTSLVVSLRTATPGASGRGRLYFPATGQIIDVASLRVTPSGVTNALGAVKTYLSAIQTAIDATLDGVALTVWSRKGAGSTSPVNSLQMGNVFDVQRRRRDSLIENYTALAFP